MTYRCLILLLIIGTYIIRNCFTGVLPYDLTFYTVARFIVVPLQILVHASFECDFGHENLYRIFGHYMHNISVSIFERKRVIGAFGLAIFDFLIVFLPFELVSAQTQPTLLGGKNFDIVGYQCYQAIILQLMTNFYFEDSVRVEVSIGMRIIQALGFVAVSMTMSTEGLLGITQAFSCPNLLLQLLLQFSLLSLRTYCLLVFPPFLDTEASRLQSWYRDINERLIFEEYEDPSQVFSVTQFPPLFAKIYSSKIKNTLRLINSNMMKVPKSD